MKNITFAALVTILIIACTNGKPRSEENKDSSKSISSNGITLIPQLTSKILSDSNHRQIGGHGHDTNGVTFSGLSKSKTYILKTTGSALALDSADGDTMHITETSVHVEIYYVDSDGTSKPLKQGGTIPPAPGIRHEYFYNGSEWDATGFWATLFHSDKLCLHTFAYPGKPEPRFFWISRMDMTPKKFRELMEYVRDEKVFGSDGESGETNSAGDLEQFDVSLLDGSFQMLKQRIHEFFNKTDSKKL